MNGRDDAAAMRGLSFLFFGSALAYALAGMVFGLYMAASHDHTFAPAHAHLNLLGWVTMALAGLYYRAVPLAAERPAARLHFALASLGVWLMTPGIALAVSGGSEVLAIAGAVSSVTAMAVFAGIVASGKSGSA